MSRYQPYPSYKESGVQWFGEIPNNWQVLRNKMLFEQTKTLVGSESSEYTLLSLTKKGVIVRDLENAQGKFPAEFDTYQIVKPDDLIFCLFDIDETPRTVGLSYNTGMITGAYTVFKSKPNIDPAYVHYYYLHIDSFKGLKPFYSGLRKTIRPDAFLNIEMPCPSSEEQTAIANFLDRETAKIDTLIAKQERMIELLNEKRSAIISHAVTKGLDPNVKMKDSGVEWLGEVPEHWTTKALKYVAVLNPSKSEVQSQKNQDCNFIPMEKLKTGVIDLDLIKPIEEIYDGYTYFRNDDILLAKVTPCFENKNIAVATDLHNGIGFGSSEIYVIRMNEKNDNRYMYYALQEETFMKLATSQMTGAGGLKRVPSEFLSSTIFPFPPDEERILIAEYLDIQTAKIDTLIAKARQAIELMKERRTALISAAVTGKIDVRGMA